MPLNLATIYSTLGNPNSLVPLGIKDVSNSLGITACSYVTGKEEGQDRFIDEFGTQALWLFGIPLFKKIFNLTAFKAFNLDSTVDARILKDKDVFEKIKQNAPTEEIKQKLKDVEKHQKLFKNLVATKFVVATALTVASYIGLTKIKQNYTEKKIRENLIKEHEKKQQLIDQKNQQNEKKVEKSKAPNFKGFGAVVEEFAFSPVKNMYILDGFITGERLRDSRSAQELAGYAIKEGSYLFFMYYAGRKIQEWMEQAAKKNHNKSITLDSRVIEDLRLQKRFENGSIQKSLEEFKKVENNKAELYDFIINNPNNYIVRACKKSDIIARYDNTAKIDTRKYIDLDEVKNTAKDIEELYSQYKSALNKGETSEQFFNGSKSMKGLKQLKRIAVLKNIGTGILALGVVTPLIMLLKRLTDDAGKEFQTKKDIKEKLINEGVIS